MAESDQLPKSVFLMEVMSADRRFSRAHFRVGKPLKTTVLMFVLS